FRIRQFDGSGTGFFFVSDDDGRSFRQAKGRLVLDETAYSDTGIQEPGLLERKDGVLWVYARTDRGYQYESFSLDGLLSFTPVRQSPFTSPASPMKIKRDPATGILYSVWNPIPNYNGRTLTSAGWGRTPLAVSKSSDDGISWSPLKLIEDDPERGYCYPALYFTADGCLLVAYCRGGAEDGMCLARLGIKKIKLDEI
ncbi:MAG: sialidase family protein, partial [Eubacteriales bacterium]|nr:sialidase family protein [Eubacteriales bacterium]